jgi:hypothetical protein
MVCPSCKRSMLDLFTSAVCEHCESGPTGPIYRGHILWPGEGNDPPRYVCVFQHELAAAAWLGMHGSALHGYRVRAVGSLEPYLWTLFKHPTLGSIYYAHGGHEVFLDHRYESKPLRVFLLP